MHKVVKILSLYLPYDRFFPLACTKYSEPVKNLVSQF